MAKKTSVLKSSIINSIVLLVFGLLLILQSEVTIVTISYVIGGILVALGAIAAIRYFKNAADLDKTGIDMVYGVVCIIMGILVIKNPKAIASIIPFIIGIIIVINSAMKLQYSLELRKNESDLWLSTLILSIVMTICGVTLIFNPFKGAEFITKMVGIFILIYAILDLISTMVIRNTFKKLHEAIEEPPIKDAEIIEDNTEEENEKDDVKEKKTTKKSTKKKTKTKKKEEE